MVSDHRVARVAFPDAARGTCRHCGRPCGARREHPECGEQFARLRDYRASAAADGRLVVCVDWKRPGTGRCGGPVQADHQVPLAENGPRDWTLGRCVEHHKRKTALEATERAARRAGRKVERVGSRSLEEGPSRRWAATATLAAPVLGVGTYAVNGASPVAAGGALALWAGCCGLRWRAQTRSHRRAVALDRLAMVLARETSTSPDDLRISRRVRWDGSVPVGFSVKFSPLFPRRDEARKAAVEAEVEAAVGVPLVARWYPDRDRVVFRALGPGETRAEVPVAPDPEGFLWDVQQALEAVVRGEVTVTALGEDRRGPTRVEVRYPASFRAHNEDQRYEVAQAVARHSEDRWKPTWEPTLKRVVFERRPPLPDTIPHPVPTDLDPQRIPFGVDEHGDVVYWDLLKSPHVMGVGSTGGGKTNWVSGVIEEASARGFDIVLIDGKGTSLAGYRHWPGVIRYGLGEPAEMHEAMTWAEDLMRRRYADVREGRAKSRDFRPVLVVLDEVAEFTSNIEDWWKNEPDEHDKPRKGKPSSMKAWRAIARLGREGRVHLLLGMQQAAAEFFDGTETRSNVALSVGMGPLDKEGAHMAFGRADIGRDLPQGLRGRCTVLYRGQEPIEAQVYWSPEPEPDGTLEADAARIGKPLRDLAEQAVGSRAAQQALEAPRPNPDVISVPVGTLLGDETIEVDLDGQRVPVTFVSLDEPTDGGDLADLVVRTAQGASRVIGGVDPYERVTVLAG